MALTVRPVTPGFDFACEITGVDLSQAVSDADVQAFRAAMDRYAVAFFRGQNISDEEQIAFSRRLGALEKSPNFGRGDGETVRMKHPELFDVSNLDENGNMLTEDDRRRAYRVANLMWHTDSSFQPGGAAYSLLSARIVPPDGSNTEFADMRAAYDRLSPEQRQRVQGLVVEHSTFHSRALAGYKFTEEELRRRNPTRQHLVQTHSGSGRLSLLLASHASHVEGMAVEEGRQLLRDLTEQATVPQFVYSHKWQPGDLVCWDNRCTMHRATPYDEYAHKRDLRRTTVVGDLPIPA
jgi:alpha-ketoglutarate-dependent 2,4-dichlorophenoxyacetate dioxygenase